MSTRVVFGVGGKPADVSTHRVVPGVHPDASGSQMTKVELDRRLDSSKSTLAERCWAVAGYANWLQDRPTASVCNSAFLKLADVFEKTPDNMLRAAVVTVMEQCRPAMLRVFSSHILVQKVHSVLEKSIDPQARALALRALAGMAALLVHNQRVHADVRNALRSPNPSEHAACVLCVLELAAVSPDFAAGSLPLLARQVTALETPPGLREVLISALAHMHRVPPTATLQAREVLLQTQRRFPQARVVAACVRAMSLLALRSRMHFDSQLVFLLETMEEDCRALVRQVSARHHHLHRQMYLCVPLPSKGSWWCCVADPYSCQVL